MFLGHDHLIFYVHDPEALDDVCARFEAAGFLLTDRPDEGRDSAATRQRLVCFADGTYVEILTVRDAAARGSHRLAQFMGGRDGWADFVVVTDGLNKVIARQSAAGLPVRGPLTHEKRLEDGRPWKVSLAQPGIGVGHVALPLILRDDTGRDLRIPGHRTDHPNGVTGMAGVTLGVADMDEAARHYGPLFGAGVKRGAGRRYDIGRGQWVELTEGPEGIRAVHLAGAGQAGDALGALGIRMNLADA